MNRSNPFDELEQFFGRSPLWGDRNRTWGREDAWGRKAGHGADVDVADYDDEFVVMADLPGYDREHIEVHAADGRLTISAERDAETEGGEGRYLRRERRHESVTRTIDLPAAVIEEEASAAYRHGVLTVTLPKERGDDGDDGHRIDVE